MDCPKQHTLTFLIFLFLILFQIDRLNSEIISLNEKVSQSHLKVEELQTLQDKQDGLLENLFNGDYGSELEDKLEAEHEEMRSTRDRLVLVAMKWRSCKDALSKVCSQFSYSVARWTQLQEYPNIPNVVRFSKISLLLYCHYYFKNNVSVQRFHEHAPVLKT